MSAIANCGFPSKRNNFPPRLARGFVFCIHNCSACQKKQITPGIPNGMPGVYYAPINRTIGLLFLSTAKILDDLLVS